MSNLKGIGHTLMRMAWPYVLTIIVFIVTISLRFPLWFVILSTAVNGAAVAYLAQCLASRQSGVGGWVAGAWNEHRVC
ncbi:hypothetical protein [Caballeronia sp. dw_19]|uniref:hypothetical protein n=1 Tax=Caballeronia sp. dw_19 TaxID=2719791 RepID=UPI001BD36A84|nr:hypothetical protein [Caballeronia sp. dw_19]